MEVRVQMAALIVFLFTINLVQSHPNKGRLINCRKYVYIPECRGVAAKRDTTQIHDDMRLPQTEDKDVYVDPLSLNAFNMKRMLGDVMRGTYSRNVEIDPRSEEYIK